MKNNFFTIVFIFFTSISWSYANSAIEQIKNAQIKSYSPIKKGLKDLVVDISSPEIMKSLNDQKIFGTINQLYFRLYWTQNPLRKNIEVYGLPSGFQEAKENLKKEVEKRLEFIFFSDLINDLKNYEISTHPKKPQVILAKDKSNHKPILEYEIEINANGLVKLIHEKYPVAHATKTFEWKREAWSDPLWGLKKSTRHYQEGPQSEHVETNLHMKIIDGVGVTQKVEIKSIIQFIEPSTKKPIKRESHETLNFTNYKINKNAALTYFNSI